ncbi:MAG: hypothetical protein M1834_008792 [Cirrosporium novae-zelandiae]|nr:MAG: hypothetical protein M1834_008792 [Cirrosporium novae-zelandiae]
MPAMLDDPNTPIFYRTSGQPPYPDPGNPQLPLAISSRQVTLRDRVTVATLVPFSCPSQVPQSLLVYLCDQLNREIEKGDTYPMNSPLPIELFGPYWFANFGAIMFLGNIADTSTVSQMEQTRTDWEKVCLGSFYIKPNYPGRSSHVCNGGFLVTDTSRNRGVGRLMGECYLDWAPKLGYTYSVFNLVYETNVASCRIWEALGFKRIGRVKGCGQLRSYPDEFIDAIIYGRDLGQEGEDLVSEERFDKIRFYLKHGKYPSGADRAEKSRLRSAATHYKLVASDNNGEEILMLKDKEVIADPAAQYDIARKVHAQNHGGINKTTATIAEKYHWVRIKETVSTVIKNCAECKDLNKAPIATRSSDSIPSRRGNAMDVQGQAKTIVDSKARHSPSQPVGDLTMVDADTNARQTFSSSNHHLHQGVPPEYPNIPLDPQIMTSMATATQQGYPPSAYQRTPSNSSRSHHHHPSSLVPQPNTKNQNQNPTPNSSEDTSSSANPVQLDPETDLESAIAVSSLAPAAEMGGMMQMDGISSSGLEGDGELIGDQLQLSALGVGTQDARYVGGIGNGEEFANAFYGMEPRQ